MSKIFYKTFVLAISLLIISPRVTLAANQVVTQLDKPVGTKITVAGIKYQIMQFEVPAFDSDKIYLVKLPVKGDPSSTTAAMSAYITVLGTYTGQQPLSSNTINVSTGGLNGFKAFYDENFNYTAAYTRYPGSNASLYNQLSISNTVGVQLDSKTYLLLNLGSKEVSQNLTSTTHIADTTTKLKALPTASTRSARNNFLFDSRELFKYVSIKLKP